MRYSYTILSTFFSFFYCVSTVVGQSTPLITGNFKELRTVQFIRELESSSGFRFYYDSLQVDSLRINLTVREQPLDKVLEQAFANTGFHFSIDRHNNVFLIKEKKIITDLPAGFFGETKVASTPIANHASDLEGIQDSNITSASLENK